MLIIGQNKKVLLNINRLSCIEAVRSIDDSAKITANDSRTYYLLGEYSNPEKAIGVLDMIREAYVNGHVDFQMPEDSEVDV